MYTEMISSSTHLGIAQIQQLTNTVEPACKREIVITRLSESLACKTNPAGHLASEIGVKKTGMYSEKAGLPMPHSLSNMP